MQFISPELEAYAQSKTSEESSLLKDLNRETHLKVLQPRMLSGHIQGRLLAMLSKMIQPKRILEIGTYTGYSALCLAEGLSSDGELHTLELNDELQPIIDKYVSRSGLEDQITVHYGDAMESLARLSEPFDLVWIDADKENYLNYYQVVLPLIPSGGYLMADNVLWSGKVLETTAAGDADTEVLKKFNDFVQQDERVENVLLPIRDGIMIVRKK